MGTILAAEVLRTWPHLKPVDAATIRAKSEIVPLALPEISEADRAKARDVIARVADPKASRPKFLEMVAAFKTRDVPRGRAGHRRSRSR